MTDRDQLRNVCCWNARLSAENRRLRNELRWLSRSNGDLEQANAELGVQLSATDALLGSAMDQALGAA